MRVARGAGLPDRGNNLVTPGVTQLVHATVA